ncbi:MAG: hypothetical protein AAGA48_27565 [Myxococcota bacterium]
MTTRGLIQRLVAVDVGPPGQEGRRFEGLRTSFRIEHRAGRQPSLGTLSIYGLSRQSIGLFRPRTNLVRLYAGYDGTARQIFSGNPTRDGVEHHLDPGGDRVLTVEATDGGQGFVSAFIVASYPGRVPWSQVITEILSATGWTRGQLDIPPGAELPQGAVFMDRAPEILDRIAALVLPNGGRWFVRDNALYILANGQATAEDGILLSSAEGNLIGSPTPTRRGIRVRGLLDSAMRPGRRFRVEHPDVSGNYVANDVVMTGDSWAGEFYMDLTGTALGVA